MGKLAILIFVLLLAGFTLFAIANDETTIIKIPLVKETYLVS